LGNAFAAQVTVDVGRSFVGGGDGCDDQVGAMDSHLAVDFPAAATLRRDYRIISLTFISRSLCLLND
jgi:hypothetical protein